MTTISTEQLTEDVDTAIRDAYTSLRVALLKLEDLKMSMIREPCTNPFGMGDDQMYEMFLELSRRLETMRAELRNRSRAKTQPKPQPQPPATVVEATPVTSGGGRIGAPGRRKRYQLHVLVPPRTKPTPNVPPTPVVSPNCPLSTGPKVQAISTTANGEGGIESDSDDETLYALVSRKKRRLREISGALKNSSEEVEEQITRFDGGRASAPCSPPKRAVVSPPALRMQATPRLTPRRGRSSALPPARPSTKPVSLHVHDPVYPFAPRRTRAQTREITGATRDLYSSF